MNRLLPLAAVMAAISVSMFSHAHAAGKADADTVVASQGGASLTLGDIDTYAEARIPEKDRVPFFDNPQRLEKLITNQLIQRQLAEEARKAGLQDDPMVKRQLDLAVEEILSKIRMERLRKEIKVPDFSALAKEEFLANKKKYVIPGKLEVKHILISTKERSDADAKTLADSVLKEIQAQPDQFDALVEKYSDDPSKASNHGLITDAGSDRYVPEFVAGARALKTPGQLSPVVKTEYGYHILKMVERIPEKQPEFAEVRDDIIGRLSREYVDKQATAHIDELRSRKLDADPAVVESLRTRYVPQNAVGKTAGK